mgnify:CR=1 FL=1
MNNKERQTLAALKNIYDAYYSLPLSVRAQASPYFTKQLYQAERAMNEYKADIRGEITQVITQSNINQRFNGR